MFEPRVAISSLSGESDAAWARAVSSHIGAAFLGGIAIDETAQAAAKKMVQDRNRTEFLPDDPLEFIDSELTKLKDVELQAAVNVRSTQVSALREAAEICGNHDAIIEINAHCRQPELRSIGCGETLLADTDRLCDFVTVAASTGVTVSVKVRTEVPGVSLLETAARVQSAGADILHVDAMDSEHVIETIATADLFVIANNGVRNRQTVREYLAYGADAVSVGRVSDRPALLEQVRAATDEWFVETQNEVTP